MEQYPLSATYQAPFVVTIFLTPMSNSIESLIIRALKIASRSSHPKTRVGAIAIRGHSVVSVAFNLHRMSIKDYHAHAEARAIRKAEGTIDRLVVVRTGKTPKRYDSFPCIKCLGTLRDKGVKELVYVMNGETCHATV